MSTHHWIPDHDTDEAAGVPSRRTVPVPPQPARTSGRHSTPDRPDAPPSVKRRVFTAHTGPNWWRIGAALAVGAAVLLLVAGVISSQSRENTAPYHSIYVPENSLVHTPR